MQSDARVTPIISDAVDWRHDIHKHPELGYDVQRTAALVADKLRKFGCDEVVEGVGQTGVVGVIHGRTQDSGLTIGLRADMDALPIIEKTGLPYASISDGRMHACGHDGHTAMLLGAARLLSSTRTFNGTAVVIFQPAEEGGAGGKAMVDDGLMERFSIQQVYGMHNLPNMPVGQFGMCAGPIMAAADSFDITLEGRGGHAALPHLSIDTTVVAAQVVVALQNIAARQVDPMDSVVVSITSVHTDGDNYNVLPQQVFLKGTVRTLSSRVQNQAEVALKKLVVDTANAYGASAVVDYQRHYPATINSADHTTFTADVASSIVGEAQVDRSTRPMMGAEDFSYMLNARPGAFVFIGNGASASLHHPEYNFNDEVIGYGCSYWLNLVERAMPA